MGPPRPTVAVLLAGFLSAIASCRAAADPYADDFGAACRATVLQALAVRGIRSRDIRFIEIRPIVQNRRSRPLVVGVQGWIGLQACPGSLVVEMSRTCSVRNVFGKDGCQGQISPDGN